MTTMTDAAPDAVAAAEKRPVRRRIASKSTQSPLGPVDLAGVTVFIELHLLEMMHTYSYTC